MKRLYAKTTALVDSKDYVRFIITGCFNTLLNFALFSGGIILGFHYALANIIAWIITVLVAFHLSSTFVFRRGINYKLLTKFALTNLISLAVSMALLTLLIKGFGVREIIASLITIPFIVTINYFAGKFLVFHRES